MPATPEIDLDGTDMTLTWVTDPPIRELEPAEIGPCKQWLSNANKEIAVVGGSKAWLERLWNGMGIAVSVGSGSGAVYAYVVSGKPVGLMEISRLGDSDLDPKIEFLAGHPLARNAGDILIEFAVNLSESSEQGGAIDFEPIDGAKAFYKGIGFVEGMMVWSLYPAKAARWSKSGGRWTLAQDHGAKYLA